MKQFLTIILIFFFAVAFSQRDKPVFDKRTDADKFITAVEDLSQRDNLVMLLPGNWENASGAVLYYWLDNNDNYKGYVFGTNEYGDKAYGQRFYMDSPDGRTIYGIFYWIGFAEGTTGDVVFTIWDWDDSSEKPGEVIFTKSVPLEEIESSWSFEPDPEHEEGPQPGAYYLEFDTPMEVTEDYVVGADISGLDNWQEGTYGLGNMSSVDGDGAEAGLAWIQEYDGGWLQTLYLADLDVDIAVFPVVEAVLCDVTFNVNMADAQTEKGVVFDPDIHSVYVSGTFNDWITPGKDDAYELHPADRKNSNDDVIFEEHFSPANETGKLPDGWIVKKADNPYGNDLKDLVEGDQQWFRYSELFHPYETFNSDWIHTGDAAMHCNWDVKDVQNAYAITPQFYLPDEVEIELKFWKYFVSDPGQGWVTKFNVLIETDGEWEVMREFDGEKDGSNEYDSPVIIDLTGYEGNTRLAFVYIWNDGIEMTIDDITVTANGEQPPHVEKIYTLTLNLEEGEHEYKYFLVEDEPTDNMGEWEGEPFRLLKVFGDTEVNDVFGDKPVHVVETGLTQQSLNVFPNPVRTVLNVKSDQVIEQIRIFDISGRLVYSLKNNDVRASIDVKEFKQGIYVLQVITKNGINAQRFNVVK